MAATDLRASHPSARGLWARETNRTNRGRGRRWTEGARPCARQETCRAGEVLLVQAGAAHLAPEGMEEEEKGGGGAERCGRQAGWRHRVAEVGTSDVVHDDGAEDQPERHDQPQALLPLAPTTRRPLLLAAAAAAAAATAQHDRHMIIVAIIIIAQVLLRGRCTPSVVMVVPASGDALPCCARPGPCRWLIRWERRAEALRGLRGGAGLPC